MVKLKIDFGEIIQTINLNYTLCQTKKKIWNFGKSKFGKNGENFNLNIG